MLKSRHNRNQFQMISFESMVDSQSIVRVIDAFVDSLDLDQLGFVIKGKIQNGAPAFRATDLLKLYYYGYLNRVRSSRRLEREALTNIEAMWLIQGARPGYKTIANFRKENSKPLQKVFTQLNLFLKSENLFDQEKVAIDGSKFRAQNSKKNNYNEKKVQQHLDHIQKKTQEYLDQMDQLDQQEQETEAEHEQRIEISQKLDHLHKRNNKYTNLDQQVKTARQAGQTQVSTTDPEARALPKKMNIVEVSYNVLTAVEAKNKLITNYQVANESDTYLLSGVAKDAKAMLEKQENEDSQEDQLIVLADKGFDTGSELKACAQNKITTIVAPRKRQSNKKNKAFAKAKFYYDEDQDIYICPQGEALTTNGNWYEKKAYNQHRASYKFQRYTCSFHTCKNCPFKEDCVGASNLDKSKGRHIERSEFEPFIEENKERYRHHKSVYRERQAIVEHPFGTIKRQWGYDYTLLRGKEKVGGEFAIIFTCYNLRRAVSILGVSELVKQLQAAQNLFFFILKRIISPYERVFVKVYNNDFTTANFLAFPRIKV